MTEQSEPKPRILIATPTYDRRVHAGFMTGVLGMILGGNHRFDFELSFQHGTLVDRARDALAEEALASGVDWLFFIDSDIGFRPSAAHKLLLKAISIPAEERVLILAVPYRRRTVGEEVYSVRPNHDGVLSGNEYGVYRVLGVPTGFTLIHREVLQAVARHSDENQLTYRNRNQVCHRFFPFGYDERGDLLGEDFTFCQTAASLGFPAYAMPDIELTHEGSAEYTGTWTPRSKSID